MISSSIKAMKRWQKMSKFTFSKHWKLRLTMFQEASNQEKWLNISKNSKLCAVLIYPIPKPLFKAPQ